VSIRGQVYAIGTLNLIAVGTVEKYNPFKDNWVSVESLPKQLVSVAAVALDDKIYVTGGSNPKTQRYSSTVYIYEESSSSSSASNSSTSYWKPCQAFMKQARCRHAAAVYKGKIWIAGGEIDGFPCTRR
jgi:N-acetylneuraminic acid mutarotase